MQRNPPAACRGLALAVLAVSFAGCGGGEPAAVSFDLQGNDLMKFSVERFETTAPAKITVNFENAGKLPKLTMGHNFVLLPPGTSALEFATKCMTSGGTIENDHLPESLRSKVVAHTRLLGPGEKESITFVLKTRGRYPYVCTFPGHGGIMKGEILVR